MVVLKRAIVLLAFCGNVMKQAMAAVNSGAEGLRII